MPESRSRKRAPFTPPATAPDRPGHSARWIAPAMVTCWLLGLVWIVVYYIAGDRIPLLTDLGPWNLVAGMGLVLVGFFFATRWR